MRILAAVLILLFVNLYFLLSYHDLATLLALRPWESPDLTNQLLLLLLTLYLLLEAVLLVVRRGKKENVAVEREGELEKEAAVLEGKLNTARQELKETKDEKQTLQTALTEQRARLEKAEEQLKARSRGRAVDLEIINLLALMQEKGRLVDFLMDDIAPYSDEQVGAAARVVHQGCGAVLKEYFRIQPVTEAPEGERVVLDAGFNRQSFRLVGKVGGQPPYAGVLLHKGWKTAELRLPRINQPDTGQAEGALVISPAEVEL